MSGIEPLAALGLVCNTLQLIEVGSQTYDLIKAVYRGGSIDDSLNQKAVILGNVSEDIKPVNRPANRREQQLVETAESCARVARQLREEIIHLVGNSKKGRLSSSVSAAVRTLWRKPRLERLKNELDEAEKLMKTGLLAQIMSTVNNTTLDLSDLGADVRSFVQEYWKGHRDTKTLMSREGLETRTHVSNAIQGTDEAIERLSQDLGILTFNLDVQVDRAKRQRLLQSLRYPGFNERRNEVREAHPATFHWVFAGDDEDSAESDSTIKWDSFSNWLKSTDTVYWISGKPGSGKSTMVKYILADPQIQATQQCLEVWSPGCLIISHYFWRPGNPMQHSIKGMLCSLLCQLLAKSETALAKILASASGSGMKGDVTDWSLEELRSTLLSIMEAYHRPVCIFLDGLDEVYPDQPRALLDMITEISIAGKTKMCLASRPEPPLQKRLYNTPQLRLQDLTAPDLTQYAYDHVQSSEFSDFSEYEYFVESLVKRAEGVFLWLVLVTRSVRTGFENGDTLDIISERVNGLQGGDLESLYKDMWDRISKDNPDTYRWIAAQYFRIMLLYNHNEVLQVYGDNLSVFTMMLASTELAEKTLNAAPRTPKCVPEETLLQDCKEVERIAEIYCFGLLEISERQGDVTVHEMVGWYRSYYDRLLPYAQGRRALVFIHRTALDFLVDTAQGQEILGFDDTADSFYALRIVVANLAHAQLFCDLTNRGSLALTHLRSINRVGRAYVDADEPVIADYTRTLMHCKRLCDLEKIFAGVSSEASVCSGVDFFKLLALNVWRRGSLCLDIFDNQIKVLDKQTLSEILHIFCCSFEHMGESDDIGITDGDVLRYISFLLTAGADPNWAGTTAFTNVKPPEGNFTDLHSTRRTVFVEFLSRILKQAQGNNYQARCRSGTELPWIDLTKTLDTLQTFIRCGADLEEKVTIFFKVARVQPSTSEFPKSCQPFQYRPFRHAEYVFYEAGSFGYICSFPAHNILNLVLSDWEPLQRLSNASEGTHLTDVRSSVADSTVLHKGMNVSVLRVEINDSGRPHPLGGTHAEWRWCVPPREHQEQISKELMSFMTLSERPVDLNLAKPSAATQALGYETLRSMLCGPHWIKKGSGPHKSLADHLVELRVFARYRTSHRESHTIEDWLKLKRVLSAM